MFEKRPRPEREIAFPLKVNNSLFQHGLCELNFLWNIIALNFLFLWQYEVGKFFCGIGTWYLFCLSQLSMSILLSSYYVELKMGSD